MAGSECLQRAPRGQGGVYPGLRLYRLIVQETPNQELFSGESVHTGQGRYPVSALSLRGLSGRRQRSHVY